MLKVSPGALSSPSRDDSALKAQREEIRKRLLKGEPVYVEPSGNPVAESPANGTAIQVPPGKLASFYWYENDSELLSAEQAAMAKFFPQFSAVRTPDGRMAWVGAVTPGMLKGAKRTYTLQVVYEHDHPHNDSFGGSIKVYSIDPNLEEFARSGPIPHTLHDSAHQLYICTSRAQDFKAGRQAGQTVTTAASAVAWAVKWIAAFELWLNGDISYDDFQGHTV
jgi:hypothetical protein